MGEHDNIIVPEDGERTHGRALRESCGVAEQVEAPVAHVLPIAFCQSLQYTAAGLNECLSLMKTIEASEYVLLGGGALYLCTAIVTPFVANQLSPGKLATTWLIFLVAGLIFIYLGGRRIIAADSPEPTTQVLDKTTMPADFHLEEFKQIKSEIAGLILRIETLARYAPLAAAALFSWLVAEAPATDAWCALPKDLYLAAWNAPLAVVCLTAVAAATAMLRANQMGAYIKRLEKALGAPTLGWERDLALQPPMLTTVGALYWFVLLAATEWAAWKGSAWVYEMTKACPPIAP